MHNETAEITIENLKAKLKHYYPANFQQLMDAFDLAKAAHAGQKRASGRPYITHPVVVADILVDLGLDVPAICAALLHDTIEDTYVTDEMIRERAGNEIADLVQGVTKLDKIQFRSKEEEQAENIRKMFIAMSKDIRVLIIKLADRLHNMRSLQYLSEERQQVMARETLDIFAPLAGRLGISPIKCELEDLALKYLDRPAYNELANNIAYKREERRAMVDNVIFDIEHLLANINVKGEVFGRTKHFYSIYRKMKAQNKTLDKIYDLTAVRVIVQTVKDCYSVLGEIHSKWVPVPGRVKDYIAAPKPNLYQSLHTTVFTGNGLPIEIQIRTYEMHRIAEFGIAAHWKYKESNGSNEKELNKNLKWVQEVLNYGDALSDSHEFLDIIRKDIRITNEVYVLTPMGDVRRLIAGATALDYAYSIHSEVGNKCVGAKINGRIATLDTVLETGDVVEILLNQNSKGPSRDWLKIVKTSNAKAKIRQFFKKELKDEYIRDGKAMLEKEAKARGYQFANLLTPEGQKAVFDRYSFMSNDEMYASVGYGGVSVHQIILKLISVNKTLHGEESISRKSQGSSQNKENAVTVKGYENPLIRFSKCCAPVPGDEIVGYISHGRGVTIHRKDCPCLQGLEKQRLIETEWTATAEGSAAFLATIQIVSEARGDVFAEITKVISGEKLPLMAINARKDKNHNAVAVISVEISGYDRLEQLMAKLKALPTTIDVFRTTN